MIMEQMAMVVSDGIPRRGDGLRDSGLINLSKKLSDSDCGATANLGDCQ